ncbi:MAG: hypothetical protein GC179_15100 [Anaerolineaceae bacterium]|nr:hypothetical protein [Anaerolineaceae bacterium]
MLFQQLPPKWIDAEASGVTVFNPRAKPLFDRARFQAGLRFYIARITRQSRKLLLLSDIIQSLPSHLTPKNGILSVPICQIKGSAERITDFDEDFYPLNDDLRNRWVRVASMMLQGLPLPPVELVRVGKCYFVVDGHHRISVSRMLHYESVDAVILAEYDHPSLSKL